LTRISFSRVIRSILTEDRVFLLSLLLFLLQSFYFSCLIYDRHFWLREKIPRWLFKNILFALFSSEKPRQTELSRYDTHLSASEMSFAGKKVLPNEHFLFRDVHNANDVRAERVESLEYQEFHELLWQAHLSFSWTVRKSVIEVPAQPKHIFRQHKMPYK